MAKSIKMIWAITFASKDNKNKTVLESKDLFLCELRKFFEDKNINYVIEELEQTSVQKMQCTYSCFICYDTTRKNAFRAVDWNVSMKNKVSKILYSTLWDKCHFMIGDDDFLNENYLGRVLNSYNNKYSVVLKKDGIIGYI